MSAGIYIIKNLANGKVYVGSSANISARWCKHRIALEAGTHHSVKLQRAWAKYGRDAFSFEVVAIEKNREKRLALEQQFIDSLGVAGSPSGYRHTAEAIAKISATQRGKKKPAGHGERVSAARKAMAVSAEEIARLAEVRPKQHTAESRARMSVSQLGNTNRRGCKDSPETRARKSAALKGRPKSDEARRNIIAAIHRRFGKSEINPGSTAES